MVSLKGSETGVSDKFVAGKTFAGKCFLEDLSKNAHTVLVSMCKLCVVNSFHSRIEWGEIDPAEKTKLTILPALIQITPCTKEALFKHVMSQLSTNGCPFLSDHRCSSPITIKHSRWSFQIRNILYDSMALIPTVIASFKSTQVSMETHFSA